MTIQDGEYNWPLCGRMTYTFLSIQLCPQIIARGPASRSRSVQASRSLTCLILSDTSPETSTSSTSKRMRFVHPEGQPYFVLNSEFDFAVVTEANVDDIETEARILDCLELANKELQDHGIKVPPQCELFLELGEDPLSCNYYFVDHIGRALFWLEDLSSEFLGIPVAMSPSHLGAFGPADAFTCLTLGQRKPWSDYTGSTSSISQCITRPTNRISLNLWMNFTISFLMAKWVRHSTAVLCH